MSFIDGLKDENIEKVVYLRFSYLDKDTFIKKYIFLSNK